MRRNDARLGLHHKVCSLNCQPKPQHLELCFPWIQDTYTNGRHLWNYTNEGSGLQAFLSIQVCGLKFPILAPQTFLRSVQNTHPELYQCSAKGLHRFTYRQVIHREPTSLYVLPKINDKEDPYTNTSETIAESYKLEGSKF